MAGRIQRLVALTTALFICSLSFANESIIVASTTSTQNSGLFGYILPKFKEKTGIDVKVIAQGTGQALETGRRGDADVLFVHNRKAEEKFVTDGFGVNRKDVMYNDFVLIGPKDDPAGIKQSTDVKDAMQRLAKNNALFISRGDKSGTHSAEKRYWSAANVDPKSTKGYRESGSGMGATLNMASGMDAYTLSDRGTWLSFKNRKHLEVVFSGDPAMFNPYGIILVNPSKHKHVKQTSGEAFIDWITSQEGRDAIAEYKINGEQLFFPFTQ
jgi:tungstate transport system substrate-binding protein